MSDDAYFLSNFFLWILCRLYDFNNYIKELDFQVYNVNIIQIKYK